MVSYRFSLTLVGILLILGILASGCTSSGGSPGSAPGGSAAADPGAFHSDFADMAGTYVSTENPSSYIVLDPTGAARVVADGSSSDTSYYMETGELKLADGSGIGPYPIRDNTLVYNGVRYQKS